MLEGRRSLGSQVISRQASGLPDPVSMLLYVISLPSSHMEYGREVLVYPLMFIYYIIYFESLLCPPFEQIRRAIQQDTAKVLPFQYLRNPLESTKSDVFPQVARAVKKLNTDSIPPEGRVRSWASGSASNLRLCSRGRPSRVNACWRVVSDAKVAMVPPKFTLRQPNRCSTDAPRLADPTTRKSNVQFWQGHGR